MLTNEQLVESLIVDLNNVVKELMNGQYLQACSIITGMTQKLANLRKTINDDLKNREETIETLKAELRMAGREITEVQAEQAVEKIAEIAKGGAK